MTSDLTATLLATLEIAVFEPVGGGQFCVLGTPPGWLARVWPDAARSADACRPQASSVFLQHFLVDAAHCWESKSLGPQRSGVWIETDPSGGEWALEATALELSGRRLLIVEHGGAAYRDRVQVLQRARESALRHQALVKDIDRKDVLLHCIVHDLRSPLISVRTLLSTLADDAALSASHELLEVSRTQLERQDVLIRTILDVFAADVSSLQGAPREACDIVEAARAAVEMFAPLCDLHAVALSLEVDAGLGDTLGVIGERTRLGRVFANLVENALRHSQPNTAVTIRIGREASVARASVDDQGPGVNPELTGRLFDRFAQTGGVSGNVGLGLHFCRITVEGWGGRIGQCNRPEGGSRFWFELPLSQ